jgi:hypothetical protein
VSLGLVTFARVFQSSIEDIICARGINRIRHLYRGTRLRCSPVGQAVVLSTPCNRARHWVRCLLCYVLRADAHIAPRWTTPKRSQAS